MTLLFERQALIVKKCQISFRVRLCEMLILWQLLSESAFISTQCSSLMYG